VRLFVLASAMAAFTTLSRVAGSSTDVFFSYLHDRNGN
jgi:hypothetical protein